MVSENPSRMPTSGAGKEDLFCRKIQGLLRKQLSRGYSVTVAENLLYKLEVDVDGQLRPKDWQSPTRGQYAFQTDILIKKAEPAIPLVVVELKFGRFNTHDIIAYSAKATRHKEIYPYLRLASSWVDRTV
jgi:hypothetical protein